MTPLALLAAAVLSASEPPATPAAGPARPVLSLDQAMVEARAQNLDLRMAGERLAQAETLRAKAWSYYLPQLSVSGGYTWNSEDVVLDLPTSFAIREVVNPATGQPVNYPLGTTNQLPGVPVSAANPPGLATPYLLYPLSQEELELQRRRQQGVQAEVQQAIFAPQALQAVRTAGRARELGEARVEAATQDVLFAVAQLYYGAASLREVVAVQERTLETWRRHETDAEQLVAHGAAPRLALLKARTDRARAEEDLIRSQNSCDAARQALATLLDRDADFDVARPAAPAAVEGDPEAAAALRPEVRAALAGRALAESQESEVTARYLPTVGLTGQWRWASVTGFTGRHEGWAVTLGARWSLFDGGKREAERAEAGHRVAEAEAAAAQARTRARDEVRRAQLDLDSARAARRKAEEQARLAAEALAHAQAAYAQGAATYLEVSDATTATETAELARVTEELSAQLAALRLARAAGQLGR
jgi:outer membrane protein, multidrug efflux system